MINFLKIKLRQLKYIESVNDYLKFINKNKLLDSDIPNTDDDLRGVTIYDVLTNKELNKLVNSIGRLDKYKYATTLYLNKKKIKDLNYLDLQFNHTGSGIIAEILFNNDKYLKEISIKYTQITNQTIAIEYDFKLNTILNKNSQRQFINDNLKSTYFLGFMNIPNSYDLNNQNTEAISDREHIYINDIFQSIIVKKLYSKLGRKYMLPIVYKIKYNKERTSDEDFKYIVLMRTLYNHVEDYYILNDITADRNTFYQYFSGNTLPRLPFLKFFQYLGNEFFYNMFNQIEIEELESRVSKYLLENYKIVKKKDYQWLVNKLRALKDSDFKPKAGAKESEMENWEVYYGGEDDKESYFTGDILTKKYTEIYSEYHDYMKTLFTMQNDSIILTVGLLTLFFTLVGVIIAII